MIHNATLGLLVNILHQNTTEGRLRFDHNESFFFDSSCAVLTSQQDFEFDLFINREQRDKKAFANRGSCSFIMQICHALVNLPSPS